MMCKVGCVEVKLIVKKDNQDCEKLCGFVSKLEFIYHLIGKPDITRLTYGRVPGVDQFNRQ